MYRASSWTSTWPPEAIAARQRTETLLAELTEGGGFVPDAVARLARAGYVAPHWPRPWGLDASPWEQLAIDAALRAAGAPRPLNPIGIGWAGPTLLAAGTAEQQERWLPAMLDGRELWCQLFSEPSAGSDLVSLRTTATRDGDEFVVQGQKVWTTLAHVARWGILLARTRGRVVTTLMCPTRSRSPISCSTCSRRVSPSGRSYR